MYVFKKHTLTKAQVNDVGDTAVKKICHPFTEKMRCTLCVPGTQTFSNPLLWEWVNFRKGDLIFIWRQL